MKHLLLLSVLVLSACGGGGAPATQATASKPHSDVVAFMGDSITQRWDLSQYDAAPTINLGVGGETTAQMLARFDAVIAASPGIVVINGGTDDLIINGAVTIDSIKAMAAAAKSAGIRVIICSLLPSNMPPDWQATFATEFPSSKLNESNVVEFNEQLLELAQQNGYLYADYYDVMLTPESTQDLALFADAVHPNEAGYTKMWAVVAPLISESLAY